MLLRKTHKIEEIKIARERERDFGDSNNNGDKKEVKRECYASKNSQRKNQDRKRHPQLPPIYFQLTDEKTSFNDGRRESRNRSNHQKSAR